MTYCTGAGNLRPGKHHRREKVKYYDIFNNYIDRNGIACAPYPEYNEMKEMIVAYDLRH